MTGAERRAVVDRLRRPGRQGRGWQGRGWQGRGWPGWSGWRWTLLAVEVAWYLWVLGHVLFGRLAGYGGVHAVEYYLLVGLSVVCVLLALVRWRQPRWTGPVAVAVLSVWIVVLLVLPLGPLGPLRQTLSRAVAPVVVAAAVRRAGRWTALGVVALSIVAAVIDVRLGSGGNTLGADLVRGLGVTGSVRGVVLRLVEVLLVVVPIAIGLLMRSVDIARRNRLLTEARAEERRQVARELHDMVANHVTGIVVMAQAAGMAPDPATTAGRAFTDIESAGQRALEAMQRMVTALRSADLIDLAPALPTGSDRSGSDSADGAAPAAVVRDAVGTDPAVVVHADAPPATDAHPQIATTLHRVVTESLTNAHRHMPDDGTIDVTLHSTGADALVVEITNRRRPGPGRVRGGGFGLVGLQERVAAVGGRLEAGPTAEGGWRVRAELPFRSPLDG